MSTDTEIAMSEEHLTAEKPEEGPGDQNIDDTHEAPSRNVLEEMLTDLRLDPNYWLPILEKKLGVKDEKMLRFLGNEDYLKIEDKTRYPWEKQALKNLLKIEAAALKRDQEERVQLMIKNKENATNLLAELRKMQSEGKSRLDKAVQEKEEKLRKAMDVPKECWPSSNESLQGMIATLQKDVESRDEVLSKITNMPSKELLLNASGGLALEGIYVTQNQEEALEKREQLINVPDDLQFTAPVQGPVFKQEEFFSSVSESTFHKSMEKLGFSLTCSAKGGFKGFNAEASISHSNSTETKQKRTTHTDHFYICTTKYNYIPLACCYIPKDQLSLSKASLQELKSIEKLVEYSTPAGNDLIVNRYGDFFKRFGSHANQGPLHFGGIYWWKATSEGFLKENMEEMKREASNALNTYVGFSYSGVFHVAAGVDVEKTNTEKTVHETRKKQNEKNIQLYVTKTGGPLAVDSIGAWKAGLVASNETWSVVDRGFSLVPVWEIILSRHREDFKDAYKMSNDLRNAYKVLTNQYHNLLFGENVASALDEAQAFLTKMDSWKFTNPEQSLIKISDIRQKLNDLSGNYNIWINVCLPNTKLQSFLTQIVAYYENNPKTNMSFIKSLMKCLLEHYDDSCDNINAYSSIINWLYHANEEQKPIEINDVTMLVKVLAQVEQSVYDKSLYSSDEEMHEVRVKINANVNIFVNSCLKNLIKQDQIDLKLLILSVVRTVGYSIKKQYFQYLLGSQEIKFIVKQIQNIYQEYLNLSDYQDYRKQAFILLTGVTAGDNVTQESVEGKKEFIHLMEDLMRSSLTREILNVLSHFSEYNDLHSLKKDLNNLISGNYEATIKTDPGCLAKVIKNVCETQKQENLSTSESQNLQQVANKTQATIHNQIVYNLIKSLGLENYFPGKMNKRNFQIGLNSSQNEPRSENELPLYFWQMLTSLDYRLRYLTCNEESKPSPYVNVPTPISKVNQTIKSVDDFLNFASKNNLNEAQKQKEHIHPMDVLMAVFHCADDFMRQYIYTKLSICQFALPFLVPRPYDSKLELPLWSFRQVQRYMSYSGINGSVKYREKLVCEAEVPIVCFTRFGSSCFSKSQILNNLLSKQKHDIFYHRNCRGSTKSSLLMEGLVEIFWFCPGGKDDDQFDKCIAFANLHGDAREHKKQADFLQEIASVNMVIFSNSDKNEEGTSMLMDMLKSDKPLICLCPDREDNADEACNFIIGLKNQNETKVLENLITTLKGVLFLHPQSCKSLEMWAKDAQKYGFVVDEDKQECREGKSHAETLMSILKENNLLKAKDDLLPLSGHLWHQWCCKDKELTCLKYKKNKSIEQHFSDIESEKKVIRSNQLQMATKNTFMISFIATLKSLPKTTQLFFLQWFKIFIDDLSCDRILELRAQYNQLWSQIQTDQPDNSSIAKMETLSTEMNACMFGLEHVLREVGQTYEALDALQQKDESFYELPKIAAEMMASGNPLELMDGDASYVPLKWVGAVLEELVKILGDKRIFVLSVLGVQSSGKSTLLNTMFGLQFAVSAGRCTRGAFMQLVEIENELKKDLNFDYILVIDTEGLRAMELVNESTLNHDNELATFVIGLGNMTLINVFGENPSEIKDILQISVQAFLRMKQVKLTPSCLFVHQNVGEVTAQDKNIEGRRNLQTELNRMTALAGEQEHCNVKVFSDVIRFDVKNHIHYFAHLWEGNPPMAPPNPTYSKNVQEVRNLILQAGGRGSQPNVLKISELKNRIEDLWKALRNENFVFSFKNSQEISVYSKLEKQYSSWTWQLRRHILETQAKLMNRIKKGDIDTIKYIDVENCVSEKCNSILEELETFFNDNKDKDILIQWKGNVEKKLKNLYGDLVEETRRQAEELIRLKKSHNKIKLKENDYEAELLDRSKKLALDIQCKALEEDELRVEFDNLWSQWITEISLSSPRVEQADIIRDAEDILFQYFNMEPCINEKLKNTSKWNIFHVDISKHVSLKQTLHKFKSCFTSVLDNHDIMFIQQVKTNLERKIYEYLSIKECDKLDYNSGYFHEIINKIQENVNSASKADKKITFTNSFLMELSFFFFDMAIPTFQEIQQAFHKANDPVVVLECKRDEFFSSFKISCQGATSITTFAEVLCTKLLEAIRPAAYARTALAVVDEMSCNYPAFNGNRSKLENYILIYLAEEEDFEKYREYLYFPEVFFENFIKKCVDGYCLDKSSRLKHFLNISLDFFQKRVLEVISEATQVVKDKNGVVSTWLDEFYKRIEDDVTFSRADLRSIEHQEIQDIEFLKEAMGVAWGTAMEMLKKELEGTNFDGFETKPYKILAKQLCGCWEQCPFCKAICTNTVSGHDGDHSVPFHRSQAISGIPWIDSSEFVTEICSTLVMSDSCLVVSDTLQIPYKHYRKLGPNYANWSITPDSSASPYWKWFVCHFRANLERDYGCKFEGRGAIPAQWEEITKEAVITQLKEQL
ncbi:interferon-induced very large GTPase 1 [Bombina bombina]|uniref:interferon-induced very large GTPase 1 n=1 Tax=Bombina bombina TaxID=8345 RepID=UPI00235A53FA|nr:interferon-induced very large GTPase 1 [Bombina bombina]